MSTSSNKAASGCLVVLLVMFLVPFMQAWAISTVWEWHIVRLGAPSIGYASAFGISCLWTSFAYTPKGSRYERMLEEYKGDDVKDSWKLLTQNIGVYAFTVGFAYLAVLLRGS